jgi:M6 family metalloprotease-like protein
MKKIVRIFSLTSLLGIIFWANPIYAESQESSCFLDASIHQVVSLGKPVPVERLASKTNIKVGVLPFYFSDGPVKILSDSEKNDYLQAANILRNLSDQKISIDFKFLNSFNTGKPASSLKQAYLERDIGWSRKDTTLSTWGFVRNTLAAADSTTDFSNLDSVILEGNNTDHSFYIAEAMDFFRGKAGNSYESASEEFFKTINTQDGFIDNAVLLDIHKGASTIAHELLHNFGLTDLYGSGTGPAWLSMMAGGSGNLLNYEKAVLGWFPSNKFVCQDIKVLFNENSVENQIVLNNIKENSIYLLKKSNDTAYLIEVINDENKSMLVFYLLEQNLRPPITVFYDPSVTFASVFDLRKPSNIGNYYNGSEFRLLLTNLSDNSATLNLIPNKLVDSTAAKALYQQSFQNKSIEEEIRKKTESEAEAKAKAEAEAKIPPKVKQVTIACFKGKVIKKITAISPKCPVGYKKK